MNNEIKTISPFKNFCVTIGALPTSYLESMSYYEMLCWLCKYLENTINPAINSNAEALKELQNYVANYFENLDVTEEINDKLDEMAESGVLAEIINVEMIGSLSNLTTTDKTDLVSAINEVNGNLSLLNLVNYTSYEYNDVVKVNCTSNNIHLYVATNSDNSIAKIYGTANLNVTDTTNDITLTFQTDLRPDENINIAGSVIALGNTNGGNTGYIQIKITGEVTVTIFASDNSNVNLILPPCLYFIKNFGDE